MLGLYGVVGKGDARFSLAYQDNQYHFVKETNLPEVKIKNSVFGFQKDYQHFYKFEGGWLTIFGDPLVDGVTGDKALKAAATILSRVDTNRAAIAEIDGLFNAVVFYEKTNSVHLVNDRNGLALLYYGMFDDQLCFASELRAFIGSGLALNIRQEAIDEFLNLGYHIKHGTYFEEVELLPPASVLTFNIDKSSFDIEPYWDFKSIEKINPSYKEAKKTLHQLIKKAVEKRVGAGERVGITLSGGLDSRLLFANIPEQDSDFSAITRGMKGCADIAVAKEVTALRSDCNHVIYDLNVKNWLLNREKAVIATSGQKTFFDMNAIASIHIHKEQFDINLDGAGAAIFKGDFFSGTTREALNNRYFKNNISQDSDSVDRLYSYLLETNSNVYFHIFQRIRRFVIFGSILGHDYGVMTRFPFFDIELLNYALSLPDELDHSRLYRETLVDCYPDYFKKIKNNNTGFRLFKNTKLNVIARVINGLKRRMGLLKHSQKYHDYSTWIKENDGGVLDKYLENKEAKIFDYVDYDLVQNKLIEFHESNKNSPLISRLLSTSIFLDSLFIERNV